jgi:hypothetical protein
MMNALWQKTRLAEWSLSLVLPPDRAASAVGDWMEDATARGNVWFWSCVVRTAIARVWSDLAESPFYFAGLALRACLLNAWRTVCCLIGFMVLMAPVFILVAWLAPAKVLPVLGTLTGAAAFATCAFQTGRWIAQRAPNRELAACVAMVVVQPLLFFVIGFVVFQVWGNELQHYISTHQNHSDTPLYPLDYLTSLFLFNISLLPGALRARRDSPKTAWDDGV